MRILSNKMVVAASVLLILFPLGYSVVGSALSLVSVGPGPFLEESAKEPGEKCAIETQFKLSPRFGHMGLLKDIRDRAVREGIRGEIGLSDCWSCHANRVRGTRRAAFCSKCHGAVNLELNCFGCHFDPDSDPETAK